MRRSQQRYPALRGWPFLGNGVGLLRDPFGFFSAVYRRLGPIVRLRMPGRLGPWMTVLSGPELHRFASADRDESLDGRKVFAALAAELGTNEYLTLLEGARHARMRRMIAPAFSREAVAPFVTAMIETARDRARSLPVGGTVGWSDFLSPLVVELAGLSLAGTRERFSLRDLAIYTRIFIGSGVTGWPRVLFRLPPYVRAKRRFNEFLKRVLDDHRASPPGPERPPDYFDALVSAVDEEGRPYGDEVLLPAAQLPAKNSFLYGASGVAYLLAALLREPALYARVSAEVDAAFRHGTPDLETLKRMRHLRSAVLEGLRLYSVVPGVPRTASRPIPFAGHVVPAGETVFLATSARHRDPETFRDPARFDPERFLPPRSEQRVPGALGVFGAGIHSCPARGFYEVLVMSCVAGILRAVRLELDPKDATIRTVLAPIPAPRSTLRFRVVERRAEVPSDADVEELAPDDVFAATFDPAVLADLEVRRYEAGSVILRQGDPPDDFFVLKSGSVEVVREEPDGSETPLRVLGEGRFFGEIGMLQNVRRTATVRVAADGPAEVWAIGKDRFRALVGEGDLTSPELAALVRRRMMSTSLARALPRLGPSDVGRLSSRFEWRRYPRGASIVREGEPADAFFVICRGTVEVVSARPDGTEIRLARLGEGEYFGEIGLLERRPRNATVRASEDGEGVEVMAIDAAGFRDLVGGSAATLAEMTAEMQDRLLQAFRAEALADG